MTFSDLGFVEWVRSIIDNIVYSLQTGDIFEILYHLMIVCIISALAALFLYIMYSKFKHYMLVDLGHHKWLIK
jgi:hypothetical protein